MSRTFASALIALALAAPTLAHADGPDRKAVDWLVGRWAADPTKDGATGGFEVSREAGGKVLLRHNHADYPASAAHPASHHDDLTVIYFDGPLRADYWDSEGHTIHYAGAVDKDGAVVFTDTATAGAHYRLTLKPKGDKGMEGKFEVEPPGAAAFATYLTWSATRTS